MVYQESDDNMLNMNAFVPGSVRRFIQFLSILAHTRMNAMGDDYNVPDLVKLANTRINLTVFGTSPDGPWVPGLPVIAEAALEIVNDEGLSEVLTTAVAEILGTILAMGTLEDSPIMTPFCLEVLKKCNAISQKLSETQSCKVRTLNEVNTKYQKAAEQALKQKTAMMTVSRVNKCRTVGCKGRFECFFLTRAAGVYDANSARRSTSGSKREDDCTGRETNEAEYIE